MQIDHSRPLYWIAADRDESQSSSPKLSPMFDCPALELDGTRSDTENFWEHSSFQCSPLSASTPNGLHKEIDYIFDNEIDPILSYSTRFNSEHAEEFNWILEGDRHAVKSDKIEMPTRCKQSYKTNAFQSICSYQNLSRHQMHGSTPVLKPASDAITGRGSSCNEHVMASDAPNLTIFSQSVSERDCHPSLPQLPRQRFSDNSTPSKYCHICGRNGRYVALRACQYSIQSLCRKVVCAVCISRYDAIHENEIKTSQKPWVCTHCRGACPKRARCVQYFRNNEKRRAKNIEKRKMYTSNGGPFSPGTKQSLKQKQSFGNKNEGTSCTPEA